MDFNNLVNLNSHSIKSFCLRNCSWKTVKDKAVLTVVFSYSLFEDTNYNIIRNESTSVHSSLSFKTVFCTVFSSLTKNIACRNLWDIQSIRNNFCLSTFTCAGGA